MYKVWRVAWTEYLNAVRSKAFIVGIVLLPVMMSAGVLVQHAVKNKVDTRPRRFAVADHTGLIYPVIEKAAQERNEREVFDWSGGQKGAQIRPLFVPERVSPDGKTPEELALALSERVRSRDLTAFVIIGADAMQAEPGGEQAIEYCTDAPTYMELPGWLESRINEEISRHRWEKAGIDAATVGKLSRKAQFKRLGLAGVSQTGEVQKAKENNRVVTFLVPAGSMILLFMLVMSSAPALLNTVLEEKMQKIAELLVSAISPFQLLLGKLLGAVMVSLTLSALYLGAVAAFLHKYGFSDFVPATHYLWFLLFQLLALFMFGSIFSAIGAACSEIRDAQNMMFPGMMLVMIPMFVWMPILQSPTSVFAKVMSLFPPATPMLMMLRIAIPPGPAWWEVALGVVLTTLFMLGCVWAASKIFRIGILSHGQAPTLGKMLSWIFSR